MTGMKRFGLVLMAYHPVATGRQVLEMLIENEQILAARPDRSKDDDDTLSEVRAAIAEIRRRGLNRSGGGDRC